MTCCIGDAKPLLVCKLKFDLEKFTLKKNVQGFMILCNVVTSGGVGASTAETRGNICDKCSQIGACADDNGCYWR